MAVSSFSTLKAALSLTGIGVLNRNGVTGNATLGRNTGDISLAAGILQTVKVTMGNGGTFDYDPSIAQITTSEASGTSQVETATAVGAAGSNGNVLVTINNANYPDAEKAIPVAITSGDTPSVWAGKVRAALAADADITAAFAVSGSGADVVLTDLLKNDDIAGFNIALTNGAPSPGITDAATSTTTTAGVASVAFEDNNADYQGRAPLSGLSAQAFIYELSSGNIGIVEGAFNSHLDAMNAGTSGPSEFRVKLRNGGGMASADLVHTFTAQAPNTVITIHYAAAT